METPRVPEIGVSDGSLEASVVQKDLCNESPISSVLEAEFHFPRQDRVIGTLIGLMCACVITLIRIRGERWLRNFFNIIGRVYSSPTPSPFIVLGFLGGFVSHDEPHHPEVHVIQELRQEYPQHVYFGLFENRKVGEAYNTILNQLGAQEDGTLSDGEKCRANIVLFGHSWGASAVVALSRKLERAGIPVTLTIQIDSVAKPF
jgi:hypothetical protein